jgi:4-amino-4-deoxy-L-arabinose transferase-like glycosyltransferase
MVQESATWDETHYFGMGEPLLKTGKWNVQGSILHPPLSFYLSSLPLLFAPTEPGLWQSHPAFEKDLRYRASADVDRGQALLSAEANRNDRLLTASRLMMVLVGVLLCIYVFKWSLALYGPWAAALAVVLCSFCPNILAHTRLITPDILLTTTSFITLYYFCKVLREGQRRDVLLGGTVLGLALLTKYSGLLLLPVCGALALIHWLKHRTLHWRGCLWFGALGAAVLLAGYRFNLEPYFSGITFQREHAAQGHAAFLLGEYSTTGWWYYYLVAFALKTPVALLLLLGVAGAGYALTARKSKRTEEVFLLLPVVVFFGFFSLSSMAIGLRYILPVYPFLFVLAAGAVHWLLPRRITALAGALLVAWYLGASLFIHPHYLAYFNELAGGPQNGSRFLVDSNLDWGQDLKGLGKFMRERGIPRICLSYFGSDAPERYGIEYEWLPSQLLRNPAPGGTWRLHDWVAISATNLRGVYFARHDLFSPLLQYKPVATIGYSIFVFDMNHLESF